jgi:hypothetical protein
VSTTTVEFTEEDAQLILKMVAISEAWAGGQADELNDHARVFLQLVRQDAELRAGHPLDDFDAYIATQDAEYQRYAARLHFVCHLLITPEDRREALSMLTDEQRAEYEAIGKENRLLRPGHIESIRHASELGIGDITPN